MDNKKELIEAAAKSHACSVLGENQYNKNKSAAKSIVEDFVAGVNYWDEQLKFLFIETPPSGIELITNERQKQIDKHGFTGEHHVNNPQWYQNDQLLKAAVTLLLPHLIPNLGWTTIPENWDVEKFEDLVNRDHKERLIIAGALIAAEIDRLNALENS